MSINSVIEKILNSVKIIFEADGLKNMMEERIQNDMWWVLSPCVTYVIANAILSKLTLKNFSTWSMTKYDTNHMKTVM